MRNQTQTPTRGAARRLQAVGLLCALAGLGSGCGSETEPLVVGSDPALGQQGQSLQAAAVTINGLGPVDTRPYQYKVPARYDRTKATPLVVMLHGFSANAASQELYFNFGALADSRTFLYAYPDGLKNPLGLRYWNATEYCCDLFKSGVDDVAYVNAIIDDMSSKFNVDRKRIFIVGHSNGGFMAHRLACELSDKIAGIASLAGAQWTDPTRCVPKQPVAVAQIHGNLDIVIGYGGTAGFPSARDTVELWANRNRCTGALTYGGDKLDLDKLLLGAETKVERYAGCPTQGPVELWTIQGGSHVPALSSYFTSSVYDFLMDHPKP